MPIATQRFRVTGTTSYGSAVDEVVKFSLERSSAFNHGNGLAVIMERDDGADEHFEARYDSGLMGDGSNFLQWSKKFARQYFGDQMKITPTR